MSVTDELLENNRKYAAGFTGPFPLPPAKQVAVLACMDARLDVHDAPWPRGGRCSRDPQRRRRRHRGRDPLASPSASGCSAPRRSC